MPERNFNNTALKQPTGAQDPAKYKLGHGFCRRCTEARKVCEYYQDVAEFHENYGEILKNLHLKQPQERCRLLKEMKRDGRKGLAYHWQTRLWRIVHEVTGRSGRNSQEAFALNPQTQLHWTS